MQRGCKAKGHAPREWEYSAAKGIIKEEITVSSLK
jgi:hypothetical protein